MNSIAPLRTVADLIGEYEQKCANVEAEIASFEQAFDRLQMSATVMGQFVENIGSRSFLHANVIRKNLLKSGWKAVYERLEIGRVATAKDKQLFERTIADPPALTLETAKATFGDYLVRPRFHILRGLAEVFSDLDPAFKSHSKVKIGVKGLPKRLILRGWGDYSYEYVRDRFRSIVNALANYQGLPHITYDEETAIGRAHLNRDDAVLDGRMVIKAVDSEEVFGPDRGLTVRKFENGNAHLFFSPDTLLAVNRALAEFYGDVLPDAEEEGVKPSASTAVSKDLQFYWTPRDVIDRALDFAGISHPRHYHGNAPVHRVLEPSCGDGRILDVLRDYGCQSLGFEYHPVRSADARAKGHSVVTANFLEQVPTADFDFVVMNPPFYGRHYIKHVEHALKFLKPGGTLVSILPATAHYDHKILVGEWQDLPVASFSEVGTNVPTGMIKIRRMA